MLTRDELLAVGRRRIEKRDLPGIGEVYMRSLSEAEWSQYQQDSMDLDTGKVSQDGLQTAKARLVALVLSDQDGNRVFKNADLPEINAMDAKVVGAIYDACEEFCGVLGGAEKN